MDSDEEKNDLANKYDNSATTDPFDSLLTQLLVMGINEECARQAIAEAGNRTDDEVVLLAIKLQDTNRGVDLSEVSEDDPFKMTFVVNKSLGMSVGKIAVQVAHAAIGLYQLVMSKSDFTGIANWQTNSEMKVVLQGENEEFLLDLERKAEKLNIYTYLVRDAGLTEIPSNSLTAIGLFGEVNKLDIVTGQLRLL